MSKDPRAAAGSRKGVSAHGNDSFGFARLSWLVFVETLRRRGKRAIRGCYVIDFWAQGPFLLAWKVWQVLFKELMNVNGHIICKS